MAGSQIEMCGFETCPVCRERRTELWARARDVEYCVTDDEFEIRRCDSCDVLYVHPMLHDRLETIYPANYYSFSGERPSLLRRLKTRLDAGRLRAALKRIAGERLAALDVGGGTGWLLDVVRRVDRRVCSTQVVDLDAEAGVLARQRGHAYFQGRIEDFETPEQFDLILMLNLIEHVHDPALVLGRTCQLLRPGGLMIVQTPNYDSLDAQWFRHRNWGGYHCPRHFVLFTMNSFRQVAGATGFQVVRSEYTQGGSFWSISVLAALARRGWIRIDPRRCVTEHRLFAPLGAAFAAFDQVRILFGARTSQMTFWLSHNCGALR
jgi:SAM-dependent methyltransferase